MIQLVTNMLEESSNIAASNFISSLVKSLQILCNGQVDFNESIELIGHINVRVDHKFKFNYIVDEQVSKEGDDASTTFLSNSYHSSPPSRLSTKQVPHDEEIIDSQRAKKNVKKSSDIPHDKPRQSASAMGSLSDSEETESAQQKYSVKYDAPVVSETAGNHMVIKVEGDDPSDDCVVLPGSPGEYNECGESSGSLHSEGQQFPGSSGCYVGSQNEHQSGPGPAKKQRQSREQDGDEFLDDKDELREGPDHVSSCGGRRASSEMIGKFAAFECSYCSVILTKQADLTVHSKNCPAPSCYMICLTCGEKFHSKPEMRQHLKFAHSHKTFSCKFCDLMFLSSSGLLSHTKAKHKPDSKTLCQICGQAFHNRANLEGHMNMHLGIRPFTCKKCGKGYGHSKSLMTHEKNCKSVGSSGKSRAAHHMKRQSNRGASAGKKTSAPSQVSQRQGNNMDTDQTHKTALTPTPSAPQAFSYSESVPTYSVYQTMKKTDQQGDSSQQPMSPSHQEFPFSQSYQALQSVDLSNMSTPGQAVGENVYSQPSSEGFVLPQLAYGLYSQELLPEHG
ncbi:zinc finger protein 316 isoform X2 [Aplysia californica]|uniref:Zinc finger protein 316 isoform X2 n=1 Tax=Aplysia californica TaxID=6500 RepID=A0ABM0JAY5_APLCA|nr:zinc finger protein 316 isoform X2 [Aplysia californica]